MLVSRVIERIAVDALTLRSQLPELTLRGAGVSPRASPRARVGLRTGKQCNYPESVMLGSRPHADTSNVHAVAPLSGAPRTS